MNIDILTLLSAVVLGIVEGLTEFIPVSSTGHLIVLIDFLGFKSPPGKVFEVVIQLGAILAVCWLYRLKIINIVLGLFTQREAQLTTRNILLAFVPAVVIGLLAHDFIKSVLFSSWVVATSLIIGGVAILFIERLPLTPRYSGMENLPWLTAIKVGFCQTLAMIPGVSRSGATILGAVLLGVRRETATEFSFFLAIPTMLGATVLDLYKNWQVLDWSSWPLIALGFGSAFIAASFVVKRVIAFIARNGFTPFGWYRIALGLVIIAFLLVRTPH